MRVGTKGLWFVNHKSTSWSRETEVCETSVLRESFFPRYDNVKIISIGNICLSRVNWMRLIDERKKSHWKFWLVLNYMYRFCECKYRFKLSFLWRKLEFYTKVHKRCTCYSLNHKTWDTFLWSNHNHTFALRTTQDIIIRFFHNMFFLISTLSLLKDNDEVCVKVFSNSS